MSQSARNLAFPIEKHAVPFDENAFVDWIVDAQANDCIAYYRGHLGRDRCEATGILTSADTRKLVAVSRRVMVAADQGLVFPVQKRLDTHDYLYLAIRAFGRLGSPLAQIQVPAALAA